MLHMLTRLNNTFEKGASWLLAVLFAALIAVVLGQVLARNVFQTPLIWSLDLAQLLFSWCIFLGAGIAYRKGGHYEVNLWPRSGPAAFIPRLAAILAAACVVYVLVWHGYLMSVISWTRENQSLGISGMWFFLPIPLGGALIGFAVLEQVMTALGKGDTQ